MDFKKISLAAVGLFAVYAIVASPAQAADLVQVLFEWISQLVKGIFDFMGDLLNQATDES
ncbi:hypothetical protein G5C51_38150 [Streptomyces sp. A7024]|uniref:Uncharacterized protein n=2 Tax=Streptomyces coryli TaxID=1128680 RepID=A0A6G4UE67_9ACTN|nr:hypothetical protein [Streptomyces coryli]NGN69697.1 hypothetical protein [Streptomyces coryli]